MNERVYALCGVVGPLVAIGSFAVSILMGFNWGINALSDLGHSVESPVAPVFNFGLLLSGFLITVYAVTVFKEHAQYTSYLLLISGFMIQCIAAFDQVYGILHYVAAVSHFIMLTITSLVYTVEKRSRLALATLAVTLTLWTVYATGILNMGIAVPETGSKIVMTWVIYSAFTVYSQKSK